MVEFFSKKKIWHDSILKKKIIEIIDKKIRINTSLPLLKFL